MVIRYIFPFFVAIILGGILFGCDLKPAGGKSTDDSQQVEARPYGKVTRYGLFRERGKGWVEDTKNTSTGKVIRGATLEFSEDTDRVALRKGIVFGYRYWLKFPASQQRVVLKRILIHPEMTLPDGSIVSRSEREITKTSSHGIVTAIDAYTFSEAYELLEGEWRFQLWFEDEMLSEQVFTTFKPGVAEESD